LPAVLKRRSSVHDSLFQSELLISEKNFLRAFPEQQGYRVFLLDAPVIDAPKLDEQFSEYGFDATSTEERLAGFHRVETPISQPSKLSATRPGAGHAGIGAVLLRTSSNSAPIGVIVRHRLSRARFVADGRCGKRCAVGRRPGDWNVDGVAGDTPVLLSRGGHVSILSWTLLLPAVLLTGLAASLVAVAAVVRLPMLDTLRAE